MIDVEEERSILVDMIEEVMKTTTKRLIREEQGKVLILVLILLVVGGLVLAPVLGLMSTGLVAGQVYEKKTAELYAADAGVEDALWKIMCDPPDSYPYEYPEPLVVNGKSVQIMIDREDLDPTCGENLTYQILSTATSDSGSSTRVVSYVYYGSEWGKILDFGVIALDGDIDIEGNTVLDSSPDPNQCHIYANGNIAIGKNCKVYGLATTTGNITGKDKVSPGPTIEHLSEPLEFTLPDISKYLEEANKGDLIVQNLTINEDRPLGPAHITGYLHIGGNAVVTLGGPVWVDGYITMDGTSFIQGKGPLAAVGDIKVLGTNRPAPDEMPVLISTENNIATGGTGKIYAVLYAPYGTIRVTGTTGVNGALIGKAVYIKTSGSNEVHYDLTVVNRARIPGIKIRTWEIK